MKKLDVYGLLESVVSRKLLWKVGRFLYLGARRDLQNDPMVNGEYDLIRWFADSMKKPNNHLPFVFLDIGANFAEWSLELVKELEQRQLLRHSFVHAFEPGPMQYERALTNLKAVSPQNSSLHKFAVGAEQGSVRFNLTGDDTGSSSIATEHGKNDGRYIDVELTSIDAFCASHGIEQIELVKIDTEGNDFNVILGATGALQQGLISVLQFEYNWRWIDFHHLLREVFEFIEDKPYEVGKLTQQGLEIYDEWHMELDRFIETNFVLIRKDLISQLPCDQYKFDDGNVPVRISGVG